MSNKFNARGEVVDGYKFQSGAEARRYCELKILARDGCLRDLIVHPVYEIIPAFVHQGEKERASKYTPDFEYLLLVDGLWQKVIEDVKGGQATKTEAYGLRRKLLLFRYPDIWFREVQA
jgi:hypothetical protein